MTPPQHNIDRPVAALLAPDMLALLDESPQDVAVETEEMHPADLADVAEAMPPERVTEFLGVLPASRAAQVLEYLDAELRSELLERMSSDVAARIISEMTPDDRVDALGGLEEETAHEILSDLPAEERQETVRLLQYEPDTAGGLMTTEFVSVSRDLTIEAALALVRAAARSGQREAMHAIYVVNEDGLLVGVMSLRELVAAPEGSMVSDVMRSEVVAVPASADREEVARIISEYDLVAVPVVDGFGRVVGVVTVDDVIDAIVEEQTEDVQRLGAVQPLEEPYFQTSFWSLLRKRGGWLVLLFVEEMFTGTALREYQSVLESATALTFFLPLVISSGGNSGSQSATLITRGLAVGDVELRDVMRVLWRELGQGLLLGAFLGVIGFGRALMWGNGATYGWVVGLTLLGVVLAGTLVGALLPLGLRRAGFDPAVASSPFVASLVDVLGIVIYFNIALRLLHPA